MLVIEKVKIYLQKIYNKILITRIDMINYCRKNKMKCEDWDYINNLKNLGDNWINGNSFAPSNFSIKLSKNILNYIKNFLLVNNIVKLPKLVMEPIPSGGICLELHTDYKNGLFISIYNDSKIEIDVKYFDFYATYNERKIEKIKELLIESYNAITEI